MNLYDRFVLPRAVELVCSGRSQARQRARVVPAARGVVLEIGFGTGLNLGHYDPARVERILAIDPADEMWRLAERRVAASPIPVERLAMRADRIRLALELQRGVQPRWTSVNVELGGNDTLRGDPRETWWPARVSVREGRLVAEPRRWSSSGDTFSLAGVNALLRVTHDVNPGASLPSLLIDVPC